MPPKAAGTLASQLVSRLLMSHRAVSAMHCRRGSWVHPRTRAADDRFAQAVSALRLDDRPAVSATSDARPPGAIAFLESDHLDNRRAGNAYGD
jgi:hypothetical protein